MGSVRHFHDYIQLILGVHSCPACFVTQYLLHNRSFKCMKCHFPKPLYFCLACCHVACSIHSTQHFCETFHSFFVSLENCKVWDHELLSWTHDTPLDDEECDTFSLNIPEHFYRRCFCYICLYKRTPRLLRYAVCMECNVTEPRHLWVCMTCGHVGCGTESKCHALQHYTTSGHAIMSQLENHMAWNYTINTNINQIWHVPDLPSERNDSDYDNVDKKVVLHFVKAEALSEAEAEAPLLISPPEEYLFLISRLQKLAEQEKKRNYMSDKFYAPIENLPPEPAQASPPAPPPTPTIFLAENLDSFKMSTKHHDIYDIIHSVFIITSSVSLLALLQYFFLHAIESLAKIV